MRNIFKKMRHTSSERIVSKMKCKFFILFVVAALTAFLYPPLASATPILGAATNFAVLGHTGVTNTGPSVVFGGGSAVANLGNWEVGANAIKGFSIAGNTFNGPGTFTDGPGLVNAPAQIYGGEAVAEQARDDFWTAYNALSGLPVPIGNDLTGADLGNYNTATLGALAPGVYNFDTSVGITGTLELNAQNMNGVYWVFQIGTTLDTAASNSVVKLINAGSNNGSDVGVFWLVGSSATINTTAAFEGNILAAESISMLDSATLYNGRAFAYNGAVTLINNTISNICPSESSSPNSGPGFSGGLVFDESGNLMPIPPTSSTVPEPATMLLLGLGLVGLAGIRRKMGK